jgi:sporulation protein YlmC with PRC-barrel domain
MRSHLHIGRNCGAAAVSAPATTLRLGEVPPRIRALLIFITAATLSGLLLIVTDARPAISQAVRLVTVDVNTVAQGYRVSKLTGSGVTNEKNEKIGTIDDFVIARNRSLFAVLQVGGFLGIGGHLVAVPYDSLVIDDEGSKIQLPGASKDELKKLTEFKYRG